MKIEHIAIWTNDLEGMKNFYCENFEASASNIYHNPAKNFKSYFLTFEDGARLELMTIPSLVLNKEKRLGFAHLALSVGSKEHVDHLTLKLRKKNVPVISDPRHTGDGYYESVVADPEGNLIEITV